MSESIIVKLQSSFNVQNSNEQVKINRLNSSLSPSDFIKLLRKADNKVNPRSSKVNRITKSIHETLAMSPELFWYKTKGILLATESCEILERNRVKISLGNLDFEGIMDGGHNTFAIATFLIEKLFDKKLKDWYECKEFWDSNYDEIVEEFQKDGAKLSNFSIPIEIIFPNNEDGALDDFYAYIAEICAARNNNVQLTETSKGNQEGLYDFLKEHLNGSFNVIWKSGDPGTIKSEDVLSMATIPLMLLQEKDLLPDGIGQFNPISIYSQKSKCVDFFNSVLGHEKISVEVKGKHVLQDTYVASGLGLVQDIMKFFDKLYVEFPKLYNKTSPGFGRIKSVDDKKGKSALFRTDQCEYNYPPGFMYPLIIGLTELIEVDSGEKKLNWKVSPKSINLDKLGIEQYVEAIKLANYDPQKVGKQALFYGLARSIFKDLSRT